MFRSRDNTSPQGFESRLHGIEPLEHKQLFASLLGDTVAEPDLPANYFYLRQDAHGGDALGQDGSDLLIIDSGDGGHDFNTWQHIAFTYKDGVQA